MSKIKNLSDLGSLYSMVQENAANQPVIEMGNKQPEVLLTDAARYIPVSSKQQRLNENAPKTGNALGSNKEKEELVKDTGPEAAEGFKKGEAKEKQEAKKETKQEEKDMEAAEENKEAPEKMEENVDSASRTPKYNKQHFTMPKSKFQKLYEDAINSGTFAPISEEEAVTPVADAPAGEEPMGTEPEMGGDEEACCTHEEAIEMVEKLLKFLKKDTEYDKEHGDLGDEDQAFTHGGPEDESNMPMEEAVETEDLGHANVGSGVKTKFTKDGHKIETEGDDEVKPTHKKADTGKIDLAPQPKALGDKYDDGKNNKVSDLKPGKGLFKQ
jgi:hypothetical protein